MARPDCVPSWRAKLLAKASPTLSERDEEEEDRARDAGVAGAL
jgi:hypothetical protein